MTVQEIWALGNFYNSVFSGEQIDAAIGIILNGGIDAAVDAAEASAAAAAKSAQEAAGSATDLGAAVKNAQSAAGLADSSAKTAESYAKGGTGTREGEDTDNAKYYCEQTRRISGGEFIASINGEGADETGNFTIDAAKVSAIPAAQKGAAGGVAELDATGKVPAAQLPATMTPAAHADTHKPDGRDPLSAADIDAAPAGYGLGVNNNYIYITSVTELDNFPTVNGRWGAWAQGGPFTLEGVAFNICSVRYEAASFNYGWQYVDFLGGGVIRRFYSRNATPNWGVWEWVCGIPMQLGVEYRTTERCVGKPVYAKRVSFTPTERIEPGSFFSIPHGITNLGEILRYYGSANGYAIPFFGNNGSFTGLSQRGDSALIMATTGTGWGTNYTFYVNIFYTKTTD